MQCIQKLVVEDCGCGIAGYALPSGAQACGMLIRRSEFY